MPSIVSLGGGALLALALTGAPPSPAPHAAPVRTRSVSAYPAATVEEVEKLLARAEEALERLRVVESQPVSMAPTHVPTRETARALAARADARAAAVMLDAAIRQTRLLLRERVFCGGEEVPRSVIQPVLLSLERSGRIPPEGGLR